jgi:hypothetical protein
MKLSEITLPQACYTSTIYFYMYLITLLHASSTRANIKAD